MPPEVAMPASRGRSFVRAIAVLASAASLSAAWSDGVEERAPFPTATVRGGTDLPRPKLATTQYSIGDPTAEEQQFLELMNRARRDPVGEGDRIFRDYDSPRVTQAYDFFFKKRPTVEFTRAENQAAFHGYPAQPPFAFNEKLLAAARAHSQLMKQNDLQTHVVPGELQIGDRITAAGYSWLAAAENVDAFADDMLHAHAAFTIDWGQLDLDPDTGRPFVGHRLTLMDFDNSPGDNYREVGVGVVADENSRTHVGKRLLTIDFAIPRSSQPQQFVTGVVFDDVDGDDFYDPGEGIGGVRVDLDVGDAFAVSSASGGYAIPVQNGATPSSVTATGQAGTPGEVIGTQTFPVSWQGVNVRQEFRPPPDPPLPPFFATGTSTAVSFSDAAPAVSTLAVTAPPGASDLVGDVVVDVNIAHPARQELRATLVGPGGDAVALFDHGAAEAGLVGTFGASLAPREPLATLVGRTYVGTWTLRVEDDVAGNAGTLASWTLRVRPKWARSLHFPASPLFVAKLTAKDSPKPAGDSLSLVAVVDVGTPTVTSGVPTLRLRAADGTHAELVAVTLPDAAIQRVVRGTSRTTVNAKVVGLDLPGLPTVVEVELAFDGVIVAEVVPLKRGAFNAASALAASQVFHVDSVTTKLVAGVANHVVKGRLRSAAPLVGPGVLEVSLGALRFKDRMDATKTRGAKTTYKSKSATGLKSLTVDAAKGTFAMTLATSVDVAGGPTEISLRLGNAGFYGAATVTPTGSGSSLTY
jgi:subtilisin-like proprotein convertase family protein